MHFFKIFEYIYSILFEYFLKKYKNWIKKRMKIFFMESKKAWNPLTEKEKLEIIKLAELLSTYHQWKFIGESIQKSSDTWKTIYNSYLTIGTFFPKQWRPPKVNDSIKQSVVDSIRSDPIQSLQELFRSQLLKKFSIRTRSIFIKWRLYFLLMLVIKQKEISIKEEFGGSRATIPRIIFTKEQKPIFVMIWGGIGFDKHVN